MILIYFLSTIFYYFRENRKDNEKDSIFYTFTAFAAILSNFSLFVIGILFCLYFHFVLTRFHAYCIIGMCSCFSFAFVYIKKTKLVSTYYIYKANPQLEKKWRIITIVIIGLLIGYLYYLIWFKPSFFINSFNL